MEEQGFSGSWGTAYIRREVENQLQCLETGRPCSAVKHSFQRYSWDGADSRVNEGDKSELLNICGNSSI